VEPVEAVLAWTDLAAAARRHAVRSRVWAFLVPLCLLLVALMFVFTWLPARLMFVLVIGFFASSPWWGPTMATWLQARRKTWLDRPTTWTPTDAGITVMNHVGASTLPWATLTTAVSWRRGVSLTYGRAVAFIPVRAFPSADQLKAFVADAQAHIETEPPTVSPGAG